MMFLRETCQQKAGGKKTTMLVMCISLNLTRSHTYTDTEQVGVKGSGDGGASDGKIRERTDVSERDRFFFKSLFLS